MDKAEIALTYVNIRNFVSRYFPKTALKIKQLLLLLPWALNSWFNFKKAYVSKQFLTSDCLMTLFYPVSVLLLFVDWNEVVVWADTCFEEILFIFNVLSNIIHNLSS